MFLRSYQNDSNQSECVVRRGNPSYSLQHGHENAEMPSPQAIMQSGHTVLAEYLFIHTTIANKLSLLQFGFNALEHIPRAFPQAPELL